MPDITSFITRFNLVKHIPIFEGLNWIELQKIARKSAVSEYKKGDIICHEGAPPDFFYCLISGRLQVYTTTADGKKDNVDFIHRGMHFGIISLLTGENHSTSFEAFNDSVILKIPKDDFHAILKSIPHLGIRLSENLSRHIRQNVRGTKSVFESSIISIYSPVNGTGSSTYAIHLALSLQQQTGKRVIFINIHSRQKTEHVIDDASPRWHIPSVDLTEIVSDHEKIRECVNRNSLKVDLLNVSFNPEDTTLKRQIGLFVSSFVGDYHYVVVDLPNEMDDIVFETLTQADIVHLLTVDRGKDLELIRNVVERLMGTLKGKFREDKLRVIIRASHEKIYLSFEEIDKAIDHHVYATLPEIQACELTERENSQYLSFMRLPARSEYVKAVTRIAREIGGVSVGLVLGGGAALGIAHIGVLKVLEQEEIPIDVVVGSSMGALLASLWAVGKNAGEIETIAKEFSTKRAMLNLLDPVFPVSGLIGGRAIGHWLKKHIGHRSFHTTRIPLKVIAYDLIRREEIIMDSGSIVEAIRKSIAIPGVIEPVRERDRLIIDGGVLNPLPTNVLSHRGIKKIIAVNVLQSPDDVSAGFEISRHLEMEQEQLPFRKSPFQFLGFRILRTLLRPFRHNISDIIVRTLQASEYVLSEKSAQQADVLIHPDLVGFNWFELYKVDELIKRGEEAARKALPNIKKLIEAG